MNNKFSLLWFVSMTLVVSMLLSACSVIGVVRGGEMVSESLSVDPGGAASVSAQLNVDMGELNIHSMGGTLLQGDLQYNVPAWKPEMVYEVSGDKGVLRLTQKDSSPSLVNNAKNIWDLRLGEGIPMDLEINLGVGMSVIDVSRIDITGLRVNTGAGDLNLDLRGTWTHDVEIILKGGVGEITLHLPEDTGVRVDVNIGQGAVNASGLEQNGSTYTNAAFGESSNRLNIQIDSGVGDVNLEG